MTTFTIFLIERLGLAVYKRRHKVPCFRVHFMLFADSLSDLLEVCNFPVHPCNRPRLYTDLHPNPRSRFVNILVISKSLYITSMQRK